MADPPAEILPSGIPTNFSSLTFDLPSIFREAVDLTDAIRCLHTFDSVSGEPDKIRFRLIQRLNPRNRQLCPIPEWGKKGLSTPGWGQEVDHAPALTTEARRALVSLALAVADVDGAFAAFPEPPSSTEEGQEAELTERARSQLDAAGRLLALSSEALWVAMNDTERATVGDRTYEKARRVFGWVDPPARMPEGLPGWGTPGRHLDPHRWRTQWVAPTRDEPKTPTEMIVYTLPKITADTLPPDLREACEAAWYVVGATAVLVYWLKTVVGPNIVGANADIVVRAVEHLDEAYLRCTESVRLVRNELIVSGEAYSDGELHAACAHDAAMKFAHGVRGTVNFFVQVAPPATVVTWDKLLPPSALRDKWDAFVQTCRSMPDKFDKLPSADKLQTAIVREAVKTGAKRTSPGPAATTAAVDTGRENVLLSAVQSPPASPGEPVASGCDPASAAERAVLELVHRHIERNYWTVTAADISEVLHPLQLDKYQMRAILALEARCVLIREPDPEPTGKTDFHRTLKQMLLSGPSRWKIGPAALNMKQPSSPPPTDTNSLAALLVAVDKAELIGMEAKVVKIIAEKGGKVAVADAETRCGGDAVSAFKRAKPKMKKQGWNLHQQNNQLCAKPLPPKGRK
jgi:hypothetical protein